MNTTRTRAVALAVLGLSLLLPACNSVRVEDTWKDPSVQKISCSRLFLAVVAPAEASRRAAETALKDSITIPVVTASESGLPASADIAALKKAVAASGCDGAAIVRVVSSKDELGYIPGSPVPAPYATLGGYWGMRGRYSTAVVMTPPTPTVDRVVLIEVSLYEVKTEKLQWTATLESINPGSAAELGAEVAQAVSAKLRSEGLIP
jgi:hypothetical protein